MQVIDISFLDGHLVIHIEIGTVVIIPLVEGRKVDNMSEVAVPVPAATLADQSGIGLGQRADERPHGGRELGLLLLELSLAGDTGFLAESGGVVTVGAELVVAVSAGCGRDKLLFELCCDCPGTKVLASCPKQEEEKEY